MVEVFLKNIADQLVGQLSTAAVPDGNLGVMSERQRTNRALKYGQIVH